jgi:hypothetical protein
MKSKKRNRSSLKRTQMIWVLFWVKGKDWKLHRMLKSHPSHYTFNWRKLSGYDVREFLQWVDEKVKFEEGEQGRNYR